MFFNLVRNQSQFGKMIHFGSGAEYDRVQLPPRVREDDFDTRVPGMPTDFPSTFALNISSAPNGS